MEFVKIKGGIGSAGLVLGTLGNEHILVRFPREERATILPISRTEKASIGEYLGDLTNARVVSSGLLGFIRVIGNLNRGICVEVLFDNNNISLLSPDEIQVIAPPPFKGIASTSLD